MQIDVALRIERCVCRLCHDRLSVRVPMPRAAFRMKTYRTEGNGSVNHTAKTENRARCVDKVLTQARKLGGKARNRHAGIISSGTINLNRSVFSETP